MFRRKFACNCKYMLSTFSLALLTTLSTDSSFMVITTTATRRLSVHYEN